jgi:hypothetical protein
MAQIKNLRDFLAETRRRERRSEFTEPIHKESELMPLYRRRDERRRTAGCVIARGVAV